MSNPQRTSSTTNPPPLRHSILPSHSRASAQFQCQQQSTSSSSTSTTTKARHLTHLHSQLAQLSANLSDLENLVRVMAVQAESMRGLGGWSGGLFMAASKEFEPEDTPATASTGAATRGDPKGQGREERDDDDD